MRTLYTLIFVFILAGCGGGSSSTTSPEPEPVSYNVNVSASTGGTVSDVASSVNSGTSLQITATPDTGYSFIGWTGSNESVNNPLSITVNADTNLVANFVENISLTFASVEGGSVSSASESVAPGTTVTVTATPDEGYRFAGWTGAVESSDNPLTLSFESNAELTANFIRQFNLTIEDSNGGSVDQTTQAVDAGTEVTITATAGQGFQFTGWVGTDVSTNPLVLPVTADQTISPIFTALYTITLANSAGGAIDQSTQTVLDNTELTITATPQAGFSFSGWTGDVTSSENPLVVNVDADASVTANFLQNVTLTVVQATGGTVDQATQTVPVGTSVVLNATPDTGYSFSGWSGAVTSTEPQVTIEVSEDLTITPAFEVTLLGQAGAEIEPITRQKVAVFLVGFPDSTSNNSANFPSPQEVQAYFNDPQGEIAQYLNAMSYGQFTLELEVFGPFVHQDPLIVGPSRLMSTTDVRRIDSVEIDNFDINDYDMIHHVALSDAGNLGADQTRTHSGLQIQINGQPLPEQVVTNVSTLSLGNCYANRGGNCDTTSGNYERASQYIIQTPTGDEEGDVTWVMRQFARTTIHEYFHGMGIGTHANSATNGDRTYFDDELVDPLVPDQLNREYGNWYDMMGRANHGLTLNAGLKDLFGWLQGRKVKIASPQTQTVTLQPINSTTGNVAVEVRLPFNFAQSFTEFEANLFGQKNEGLFIEVRSGDDIYDFIDSSELDAADDGLMINLTDGLTTRLVDASPTAYFTTSYGQRVVDLRDVVLKPGMSFTDESGKITIENVVNNADGSFTFDVTLRD